MDTTRTTLSCGGHAWPAVATGEVGAIGRALERAQPDTRVKITSGTLNVAGTGPLAGDFSRARARPSLSLSLRLNAREDHNPTRQHCESESVMLSALSHVNVTFLHHRTTHHRSCVHSTAPLGGAEDRAAQPPYSALALRLLFSRSPSSPSVPCPHYQVSSTCRIRLRYSDRSDR